MLSHEGPPVAQTTGTVPVAEVARVVTLLCAAGAIGNAAWDSGQCLPASYTHETTAPIYLGNTCHAAFRPLTG